MRKYVLTIMMMFGCSLIVQGYFEKTASAPPEPPIERVSAEYIKHVASVRAMYAEQEYEKNKPYKNMPLYNIPLPDDIKKYIWLKSESTGLSYELILAVISGESSFNSRAIGYNKNERGDVTSRDLGLMQLNDRYMYAFAKDAGIEDFDPFDPYKNIDVGVFVLTRHYRYFSDMGLSEDQVFALTLSKYNTGRDIIYHRYVDYISRHKESIERSLYSD